MNHLLISAKKVNVIIIVTNLGYTLIKQEELDMPVADKQLLRALKEENIYLKEQNQDLKAEVDRLWSIIQSLNKLQCNVEAITNGADILAIISNILDATLDAVNSLDGSLLLLDEETNELVFVAVFGEGEENLLGHRIPADAGIAGWVATHQEPTLVSDVQEDPRWSPATDQSTGFVTSSLMGVPLEFGNRVLGVLEVVNHQSNHPFEAADLDILILVSRLASFILAYAEEVIHSFSE